MLYLYLITSSEIHVIHQENSCILLTLRFHSHPNKYSMVRYLHELIFIPLRMLKGLQSIKLTAIYEIQKIFLSVTFSFSIHFLKCQENTQKQPSLNLNLNKLTIHCKYEQPLITLDQDVQIFSSSLNDLLSMLILYHLLFSTSLYKSQYYSNYNSYIT